MDEATDQVTVSIFLGRMAVAGSDYVGRSNVLLTFNAITRTNEVLVDLLNDSEFEGDEDFNGILTLTSGERVVVDPENAPVTIVDNDGKYSNQVV